MKRQLTLLVATTVLLGGVVGGSTFAFFTATSGPTSASLSSGTLSFEINDHIAGDDDVNNSAIIYVNNMAPGDRRESVAEIKSTGSLDLIYRFNVLEEPGHTSARDNYLEGKLQVEFLHFRPAAGGTDTYAGQTGFWEEFGQVVNTPTSSSERTLAQWFGLSRPDYQDELSGVTGTTLPPGAVDYVKIRATLPLNTDNQAQGASAAFRIVADGYQKKNRGLTAQWYAPVSSATNWRPTAGQSPILTRIDPNIDYDWDQTNMIPGNPGASNNVYVKWTGKIIIPTTGNYKFRTVSDDGVQLKIDGTSVINNWTEHAETTNTSAATNMAAGEHDLFMELYDHNIHMTGKLLWLKPGLADTAANWQIVPQEFLKY